MTDHKLMLLLAALLAAPLAGCPTSGGDDDDSAGDDDDATGDDDDATGDDDDATGDDDDATGDDDDAASPFVGVVLHAPFGGDATVATVSVEDGTVTDDLLGLTGSDWALTLVDKNPWLIGRTGTDAVRQYEGLDFSAPALEFSTGAGTNPQGVALCDGKIFVSRYDLNGAGDAGGDVAMFDAATGGPLGSVDLSSLNPHMDGTPEPESMVVSGTTLYVALQRMDRDDFWTPDAVGKLAIIDCTTGTLSDDWDTGPNPRLSSLGDDKLLVRHNNGMDIYQAGGSGQPNEVIVDADLGAGYDSLDLAVGDDGLGILVTEVDFATNEIWCLDLSNGSQTLLDSVPQRNWSVTASPEGTVWALWRDHWATDMDVEPGGISVYDPATCTEVTTDWFSFGSDPVGLVFYEQGGK